MFIVSRTQWGTSASYILLDVTEEFLRRSFLHLDVSEELLACIFQTGPKEIDDERSRGQVIDLFTKKSKTCPSDLIYGCLSKLNKQNDILVKVC